MKKSRFTETQIVSILKQYDQGPAPMTRAGLDVGLLGLTWDRLLISCVSLDGFEGQCVAFFIYSICFTRLPYIPYAGQKYYCQVD